MTKYELNEYRWIMKNKKLLEERLKTLRSKSTSIASQRIKDEPRIVNTEDRMAKTVCEIVDTEEKIKDCIEEANLKANLIEEAINQLPEKEKFLIRSRYIEGKSWEQISVDMDFSCGYTMRLHSEALALLIDGTKCY